MTLMTGILSEPGHLLIWVAWLILINSASVLFLERVESRVILASWLVNIALMTVLAEVNGYNRMLGLSHVLAWTPLLIYLWRRRAEFMGSKLADRWVRVLFATNAISLAIDYVDVVRYFLAECA